MSERDTSADAVTDGRRLRREQGRLAVVDAVIDLMLDGDSIPTADQIAARAEVSVASVHRYFSSLGELRQIGLQRYFERIGHLLDIDAIADGPLDQRIDRLVEARLAFYETTKRVGRHARRQAPQIPALAETLQMVRSTLTDQIAQHFEPELASLSPTEVGDRVAVISTLTSFEAWDQLLVAGATRDDVGRTWRTHLALLLAPVD
jgi:AcrR family transcriptional regulator